MTSHARGRAVAVLGTSVVAGVVLAVAAPTATAQAKPTADAVRPPQVVHLPAGATGPPVRNAAGGFGLGAGALDTVAPTASGDSGPSTGSTGGCAGYASSVGASMYCLQGGVSVPTLRERFGGTNYDPCRAYETPAGMKAPRNKTRDVGRYYLQACMDGVDFDTVSGGDIKVTLSWIYVDYADGDPTKEEMTPLEAFLWEQALNRSYPIPFVTAWPTHIPRVNVPTWFQFRWLSDGTDVARQGPYSDNEDGGPYLEEELSGVTLRAESTGVFVDPQVEGMDRVSCGAVPKPYNQDGEPTEEDQPSTCVVTFEHSSAAEDLSEVPLPAPSEDYPIPMFVVNVEVKWHVTMTSASGSADLGTHTFTAYQQLPVTEVPGLAGSGG